MKMHSVEMNKRTNTTTPKAVHTDVEKGVGKGDSMMRRALGPAPAFVTPTTLMLYVNPGLMLSIGCSVCEAETL